MVRVTGHDVARLAGVSQPTVSRALRNLPGTSVEVRQRVRAAADELAYVPSASGRTLATRKTRRIAVVVEELTNPFYPELVEPLRQHLSSRGYQMVLITDRQADSWMLATLSDGSYDGALLCTVSRRSTLSRDLDEAGVPHVLVNRTMDLPNSSSCSFDNFGGSRALGRFIGDLGHRQVGAIQGPTQFSTGRQRSLGIRTGLRQTGAHIRREHVRRVDYTYAAGMTAALDLLSGPRRPTALVCGNDVLAIGALAAADQLRIRVPDNLTIVGFDDISMASWGLIDLTTIRCDLGALAHASTDLLLETLNGDPARHVVIPTTLVHRSTHAKPS